MLEYAKDIVIALINQQQIANTNDTNENINQVKTAIKEIYQELLNTKKAVAK